MERFGLSIDKISRSEQMRVANILTQLGWEKSGQRKINGKHTRL